MMRLRAGGEMMLHYENRMRPVLAGAWLLAGVQACSTQEPQEYYEQVSVREPTVAATSSDAAAIEAESADSGEEDQSTSATVEGFFAGCGAAPDGGDTFSRQALRQAALACVQYHYCGFEAAAAAMDESVERYAGDPQARTLEEAQSSFRAAMALWSRLELMQFGPLADTTQDMYQGRSLRELVYSWPQTSQCRVDEQLLDEGYKDGADSLLVSARGLDALELLLFHSGEESGCPQGGEVQERFAALSATERAQRQQAYVQVLAGDMVVQSEALSAVYRDDGDFARGFVDAEASGYPSDQEALNVLAWSLIYLEKEVKDWKLGVPAGVTATAPTTGFELPFSGLSGESVQQNLRGFYSLYAGCGAQGAGLGFDDWLVAAGHDALAADIASAYAEALEKVDALPADLAAASEGQLTETYAALRELTVLVRAELFGAGSPLNLKLPATLEGDTD